MSGPWRPACGEFQPDCKCGEEERTEYCYHCKDETIHDEIHMPDHVKWECHDCGAINYLEVDDD